MIRWPELRVAERLMRVGGCFGSETRRWWAGRGDACELQDSLERGRVAGPTGGDAFAAGAGYEVTDGPRDEKGVVEVTEARDEVGDEVDG